MTAPPTATLTGVAYALLLYAISLYWNFMAPFSYRMTWHHRGAVKAFSRPLLFLVENHS
jgi:hypothetical protein